MIRAGNIEQGRAANPVFPGYADSGFHFRQFARYDDLPRCIDVRNIDVFICRQLAHHVFIRTDHCRHRSVCCRASFIHQFAASFHKL